LLIAKEHGHRILTMLTVYAAWTEGAVEADFWAIHDAVYRTDLDTLRLRSVTPLAAISTAVDVPQIVNWPFVAQEQNQRVVDLIFVPQL
jgi:hypothetical protein